MVCARNRKDWQMTWRQTFKAGWCGLVGLVWMHPPSFLDICVYPIIGMRIRCFSRREGNA